MYLTLGIIFLLLLLSAFFSGSETALTAASKPLMHRLAQKGDTNAITVNRLHKTKDRLIGALLIGNNLVNITASALVTSLLISIFGQAGVIFATLSMTVMIVIFSEVIPKTYAIQNADKMSLRIARLINFIVFILTPATLVVNVIASIFLKLAGADVSGKNIIGNGDEELRGAIELHKGEDHATIKNERAMLRSVLDLSEVKVAEVMTHRRNTVTINADLATKEIITTMLESPYTRVPIWKDTPDNIIGILHAKTLLLEIQSGTQLQDIDINSILINPWFVPEQTPLLSQLNTFRQRREHFSLVVDEYGGLMGIVTLEDIIEEIVGEIDDEHDIAAEKLKLEDDGSLIVEGSASIRDLNRDYEWRIADEDTITIAGLILKKSRTIPEPGQRFVFGDYQFEVMDCSHRQIISIRITPPEY